MIFQHIFKIQVWELSSKMARLLEYSVEFPASSEFVNVGLVFTFPKYKIL